MKSLVTFIVFSLLSLPPIFAGQDDKTDRIAIASQGKSLESSSCNRAGRCKYFILFDRKGELAEVLENPHRDVLFDAGREVVDLLAAKGVKLLVADRVGTRMIEALQKLKISRIEYQGTVEEALEIAMEVHNQI